MWQKSKITRLNLQPGTTNGRNCYEVAYGYLSIIIDAVSGLSIIIDKNFFDSLAKSGISENKIDAERNSSLQSPQKRHSDTI